MHLIEPRTMEETPCNNQKQWYVLRVTYQRELIAQEKLRVLGIDSFVPVTRERFIGRNGKCEWKRKAALHNYIFVHSSREQIDEIKRYQIPWLRYIISPNREKGRDIMTVEERQMENFIAIAGNEDERIIYLNPDEINLTTGDRVRVVGGPFQGAEGIFIKLQGKREKRVVVKIDGIAAVATTAVPRTLVEKL